MEMGSQDYLVSFKEVPQLGRELASLLREIKIQNEVYLLLQQQYYKEKIQEHAFNCILNLFNKYFLL